MAIESPGNTRKDATCPNTEDEEGETGLGHGIFVRRHEH
jgi:hypothetical protein